MTRHFPPPDLTTKEFYFNHVKGLSNSGMGKVQDWLDGREDKVMPEKAFRFGSMVDAMLTQPDELDETLSDEELLRGFKLSQTAKSNPLCSILLDKGEVQAILTKTVKLEFEGIEFEVEGKCMLDIYLPKMKIGADIKTTAAKSYNQFLSSIERFSYDRQAFWYMEIAELDRFPFIGLSKTKNVDPFVPIVKRGDPIWLSGKEKASMLAYYSQLKN